MNALADVIDDALAGVEEWHEMEPDMCDCGHPDAWHDNAYAGAACFVADCPCQGFNPGA